jgi:hypothetical protein
VTVVLVTPGDALPVVVPEVVVAVVDEDVLAAGVFVDEHAVARSATTVTATISRVARNPAECERSLVVDHFDIALVACMAILRLPDILDERILLTENPSRPRWCRRIISSLPAAVIR